MSSPVRLSVMGAGLIGKRHIEHILLRAEAVLSSIVDPVPAARELAVSLERHFQWLQVAQSSRGHSSSSSSAAPGRIAIGSG